MLIIVAAAAAEENCFYLKRKNLQSCRQSLHLSSMVGLRHCWCIELRTMLVLAEIGEYFSIEESNPCFHLGASRLPNTG